MGLVLFISLVAAILLQLLTGYIDPSLLAMPVNLTIIGAVVYIAFASQFRAERRGRVNRLATLRSTIAAISALVVSCLIIGLVPQITPQHAAMQQGLSARLGLACFSHSWLMAWVVFWFLTVLGSVVVRRARASMSLHNAGFMLNHAGLWLTVTALFLGSADMQQGNMVVAKSEPANVVYSPDSKTRTLPYSLQLIDFEVEQYPNGTPMAYNAKLMVDQTPHQLQVNKPLKVKGDWIYLSDWDKSGNMNHIIVKVVSQPWLVVVYVGFAMLVAGAIILFMQGGNRKTD